MTRIEGQARIQTEVAAARARVEERQARIEAAQAGIATSQARIAEVQARVEEARGVPTPSPSGVATPPPGTNTVPAATSTQPAPSTGPVAERPPGAPGTTLGNPTRFLSWRDLPPWMVPEYFTFALGAEYPVGFNIAFTLDGHGQLYFTFAADGGWPGIIGEGMFGWNMTNENLSEEELQAYLTGLGASATGGAGPGIGLYASETYLSDTEGNKLNNLFFQGGLTTPGANLSVGQTWLIWDFWGG